VETIIIPKKEFEYLISKLEDYIKREDKFNKASHELAKISLKTLKDYNYLTEK